MINQSFFNKLEIKYEKVSHNYKLCNSEYIETINIKVDNSERLTIKNFLDATKSFLPFFDLLGAPYKIVKSDMNGNITKIENVCAKSNHKDFYGLLNYEVENHKTNDLDSATTSLIWLLRALKFVESFLSSIFKYHNEDTCSGESLIVPASNAYNTCLRPYHGWFVQKIFSVICRVIPTRSDLLSLLGPESSEEKVIDEINEFLYLLSSNIEQIDNIYSMLKIDTSISA